jgi:hypothetical protein
MRSYAASSSYVCRKSPASAATSSAAARTCAAARRTPRRELDVVAVALVAEEDVERHDAPVRKALGASGKVGGRVEDDRRVLGGEVHLRGAADRVDDLVELLVLREARDGAGLVERVDLAQVRRGGQADDGDVRAASRTARVAWTPSMPAGDSPSGRRPAGARAPRPRRRSPRRRTRRPRCRSEPERSSSASRKTWLSSTRTRRIGSATAGAYSAERRKG